MARVWYCLPEKHMVRVRLYSRSTMAFLEPRGAFLRKAR